MKSSFLLGVVAAVLVSLPACKSGISTGSTRDKLAVDSTVAPVTDIVRQVVGDRVGLTGLIPEGVDSHTFEASPATVKSLSRADVLFMDGLGLEGSILRQARANMRRGSPIVAMGDLTVKPGEYAYDFTFPKSKGDPNPHLWMNPVFVKRWAEIVRDTMIKLDERNADYYRANEKRFAGILDRLDAAIADSINSIPEGQKKLLTYHDSYAYFSRRYGIAVLGAIQPSDFSEPSPREVQRLVEQVKANHVSAIFGSEVFPSKVLEQVARESGADYIDKLRDDELPGRPGDSNHTYVGMMVEDVRIMTQALGGDPSALKSFPTGSTYGI